MFRQAVSAVNGRKLVKARVVTFEIYSLHLLQRKRLLFLSDFTKIGMCRQILLRFLNMKLDSLCYLLTNTLAGLHSNPTRTTDSHLRRIKYTYCCIHTVVPPDDGPRYARNM